MIVRDRRGDGALPQPDALHKADRVRAGVGMPIDHGDLQEIEPGVLHGFAILDGQFFDQMLGHDLIGNDADDVGAAALRLDAETRPCPN